MEYQSLVTIVPWQFIFTIINLFIQVLIFKKLLFKPINSIIEKRQKLADEKIRDAADAQAKADALKSQYEQGIADAKSQATQIIQDAQKGSVCPCGGSSQTGTGAGGLTQIKAEAKLRRNAARR